MNNQPLHDRSHLSSLLLQSSDVPAFHIAGELQIIEEPHPILRNVGNAQLMATQWIGNRENRAELGGDVRLYLYHSRSDAQAFHARFVQPLQGQGLISVGEQSILLEQSSSFKSPRTQTTRIVFLRCRAVIDLRGFADDYPGSPRGVLTKEAVIAYAKRLDQRLRSTIGVCD